METWGPLRWTAVLLLAVGAFVALVWAVQLTYLKYVEGPAITTHAQNVRHSLDFTQAANQRAEGYMVDYAAANSAGDTAHANALRNQICGVAHSLNPDEQASDVRAFVVQNCGG